MSSFQGILIGKCLKLQNGTNFLKLTGQIWEPISTTFLLYVCFEKFVLSEQLP